MSSTITTTTVAIAAVGSGPLLGFVAVMALLGLLALREVAHGAGGHWDALARNLFVVALPLLAAFAAIVASRVVSLL